MLFLSPSLQDLPLTPTSIITENLGTDPYYINMDMSHVPGSSQFQIYIPRYSKNPFQCPKTRHTRMHAHTSQTYIIHVHEGSCSVGYCRKIMRGLLETYTLSSKTSFLGQLCNKENHPPGIFYCHARGRGPIYRGGAGRYSSLTTCRLILHPIPT